MIEPFRTRTLAEQLVVGSVFATAGTATGIWLPPGLMAILATVVLLRLCWLDDNIQHDLLPKKRVPGSYLESQRRRGLFRGPFADGQREVRCSKLLASQLRIQTHAWHVYFWAALAGAILTGLPFPLVLSALAGGLALVASLRGIDRFAEAQATVLAGRPLAARELASRGWLADFLVNDRRGGS